MALLVILIIFLFPEISLKTLKNEHFFSRYISLMPLKVIIKEKADL